MMLQTLLTSGTYLWALLNADVDFLYKIMLFKFDREDKRGYITHM